ncbi:hypothetical protein R4Z10_11525 [Niallia sp. XMNu-256]|uniref:hypothetical protein n=1 Tax=Niallia sp. XMNu-256 TaxID=3082444 RepID=UPI0030D352B3
MSMLTSTVPFLIIFILVTIGYLFYKLGKKYITIKVTHWLLAIYLLILLVATTLVPFMADSTIVKGTRDQQDQDEVINQLYAHLQNGEIDSIKDKFLVLEQTFEHRLEAPLRILSPLNDHGISVFIEQIPENNGKIEAFVFQSAITFNQMDFSEVLENMELEKQKDVLKILVPVNDIHVSILGPSLPVRQLNQNSIMSHSSSSSEGMIYLRVPENVKIVSDENVFLNYVEK